MTLDSRWKPSADGPESAAARYAGPGADPDANIERLLGELEGQDDRRARFRTVVVAALADGSEVTASGTLEGSIAHERRGNGGFGYDPVFVPDGNTRTLAEMDSKEKHGLSHRGIALRNLASEILGHLGIKRRLQPVDRMKGQLDMHACRPSGR